MNVVRMKWAEKPPFGSRDRAPPHCEGKILALSWNAEFDRMAPDCGCPVLGSSMLPRAFWLGHMERGMSRVAEQIQILRQSDGINMTATAGCRRL